MVNMVNYNVTIIRCRGRSLEGKLTYGDIADKLVKNLQLKLLKCGIKKFRVERGNSGILIYSRDSISVLKCATTVFGVTSVSPAIEVNADIYEITNVGSQAVIERISDGCTFTVKARGEFKNLPFTGRDVEVCLSAEVLLKAEERGFENIRTNWRKPYIRVFVDVEGGKSYIYFNRHRGIGGLPYGIKGKILSIVSGDINYAVSTWIMAREGYSIIPVQFNLNPCTSRGDNDKAINILKRILEYTPEERFRLYLFDHTYPIKIFTRRVPREMMCIVCRAVMYKVAEKLCNSLKANGIVASENMESPPKTSLSIIDSFIRIPILRPLTKFNKCKVRSIARRIGVYDEKISEAEKCILAFKGAVNYEAITRVLEEINWSSIVNKEYRTLTIKEVK